MTPDLLDLETQLAPPADATWPDVRPFAAAQTYPDVLLLDGAHQQDLNAWKALVPSSGTGLRTVEETVRRTFGATRTLRSSYTDVTLRHLVPRPELPLPRHYLAFRDLVEWLSATNDEVSAMLGVRPTTHYHWKKPERTPRTANVRAVLEHHNVLGTLRERLGAAAFEWWLTEGGPSRRDTILTGGLDDLRPEIYDVIFAEVTPNPMVAAPVARLEPIDRVENDLAAWAPDAAARDELD